MPKYRQPGVGSAIGGGIGAGLSGIGELLMKQVEDRKQNELIMQRQRAEQDNAAKIAARERAIANPFNAKKEGFPDLGPTSGDLQRPIAADIGKASSEAQVPGPSDIVNLLRTGGGQITNDPSALTGGQVGVSTDDFIRQLTASNDKTAGFKQAELDKPKEYSYIDKTGTKQSALSTVGNVQNLGEMQTERSPAQEASTAGGIAGARNAYDNGQLFLGDDGYAHSVKYGPGGAREVPLPDGLHLPGEASKGVRPLTGDEVRTVMMINAGEVEGVKVMKQLHALGLDQSNDPLDPRWNQFLVQTVGIEPSAWEKADIQQRVAFIQASNLRTLMGGRPAQYIAQIIEKHTPKGSLSGMQLAHVLENVMDQNGEIRGEMANVTGKDIPGPNTGQSWEDYLKVAGRASQAPRISPAVQSILNR